VTLEWGSPTQHTEAFHQALEEYRREHPDDTRPFHELELEPRTFILARQVEIYREMNA
jgi:hypothetical protein